MENQNSFAPPRNRENPGLLHVHGLKEPGETRIRDVAEAPHSGTPGIKLASAAQCATALVAWLHGACGVLRIELAGSYRRMCEMIDKLEILVSAESDSNVMSHFVRYDEITEILTQESTDSSVILNNGLQVSLHLIASKEWGAALCAFTGSAAHTVALGHIARENGLSLNAQGVFQDKEPLSGESEASVYGALGLPWIAPELRENRGEIEAARDGYLPELVKLSDLRGDLHTHTRASDGSHTLEEMALAAKAQGLAYLAITEHSLRLTMEHGLDPRRLAAQCDEIDRLNETLSGIVLLKGIEVDILEDGSLDLPDSALARLDLVIGAVHSRFDLPQKQQTERILRAMDNPYFTLLAHPTGRLIEQRPPYSIDIPRIIRHARQRGCYLELNANPERLDLLDTHCRMAREEGVLVAINSDAHRRGGFTNLRFGIGQARRGWLSAADVLNTRTLPELRKLLAKARLIQAG